LIVVGVLQQNEKRQTSMGKRIRAGTRKKEVKKNQSW
jgi:hypothetical protein